ncbi:hypothetical protein Vi05172_g3021 [Venturia inaequalis]|nr:hypothetical protein Vi05172_g3021 [Venturia inaequalis]
MTSRHQVTVFCISIKIRWRKMNLQDRDPIDQEELCLAQSRQVFEHIFLKRNNDPFERPSMRV